MIRLAGLIFALILPAAGFAADFVRGMELAHSLSVCLDKAAAIAILEADAKSGRDAAEALWVENDRCQTVPVVGGPTVGSVVQSATIERDGKKVTSRAIEIVGGGGRVIGYFLTTGTYSDTPIKPGAVEIKPDPKTLHNS